MAIALVEMALKVDAGLSRGAKLVLIGLCEHADDSPQPTCYPGIDRLAGYGKCERRSVFRQLDELEDVGLITRERFRGQLTRYHLDRGRLTVLSTRDASVTRGASVTRDASNTVTRDASVTAPVTPASPEPSVNRQKEPSRGERARATRGRAPNSPPPVSRLREAEKKKPTKATTPKADGVTPSNSMAPHGALNEEPKADTLPADEETLPPGIVFRLRPGLDVSQELHSQLLGRTGQTGAAAEAMVQDCYQWTVRTWAGRPITGNVWTFVRAAWDAFIAATPPTTADDGVTVEADDWSAPWTCAHTPHCLGRVACHTLSVLEAARGQKVTTETVGDPAPELTPRVKRLRVVTRGEATA